METPTANPGGVAPSNPGSGSPPPVPPGPIPRTFKGTDEERRRWKLKAQLARARKSAAAGKVPSSEVERLERELGNRPVGIVGPEADALPATPGPVGPVPWDASVLAPLFATVVPEVEKLDVASLRAKAAEIDGALASQVERDAHWNPVAKATVITTGPAVVAQVMNSAGISAEHAPAIALVTALGSIMAGRMILARKLEEIAASRKGPPPAPPVESQAAPS